MISTPHQPVLRDLVLIGGGHSHVGVLRHFAMRPEPGLRITVICTDIDTPYSGMLPGYIAGHYTFDEVHIDLGRLCAWAQARLYHSAAIGIDRAGQRVLCDNRPAVPYDLLSINIGSRPGMQQVLGPHELLTPVKPIAQFNQRWQALLAQVRHWPAQRQRMRVAVVGGGAGGGELLLAMQHRLRHELQAQGRNPHLIDWVLLTADATILPTHNRRVRTRFARLLQARGIDLWTQAQVVRVEPGAEGDSTLHTQDGRCLNADAALWVTQASGPAWLKNTGLALDANGFVQVNTHLQSVSDPRVFAAGDIAAWPDRPLEKAGVFAVRMGRPLAHNLRRALRAQPLLHYRPQRHWLALISTGERFAVASRGPWSWAAAWLWQYKDWIDRRFMRRFHDLPAMPAPRRPSAPRLPLTPQESLQAISAIAMRCGGCGAKVGVNVLERALAELQPITHPDVLIGLHTPDDAAVVRVPPGMVSVHTVDFFRAFIDDPYRFGKVAANHALGDIFAMGAQPQTATAVATVPPGLERQVQALLTQMMSGAIEVLNAAGCALVGGHTGEGAELALGFAITGLMDEALTGVLRKSGMQAGDALLLTKPLGTGTLFAAHAQHAAKGRWIVAALQSMEQSHQAAVPILRHHGARACTDVTGFGLLGHLAEMTRASGVDATLHLGALPLLDGALQCLDSGIFSSLQPANTRLRRALNNLDAYRQHPHLPLLFDPQTAGGLLAAVPAAQAQACVQALHAAGYPHSAIIGHIHAPGDALAPIGLLD